MKNRIARSAVATLLGLGLLGVAWAGSAAAVKPVSTEPDVYIDPPTLFAYVKTPAGWKFVRKVEEKSYRDYKRSAETDRTRLATK
jgi:hypothetical protein